MHNRGIQLNYKKYINFSRKLLKNVTHRATLPRRSSVRMAQTNRRIPLRTYFQNLFDGKTRFRSHWFGASTTACWPRDLAQLIIRGFLVFFSRSRSVPSLSTLQIKPWLSIARVCSHQVIIEKMENFAGSRGSVVQKARPSRWHRCKNDFFFKNFCFKMIVTVSHYQNVILIN